MFGIPRFEELLIILVIVLVLFGGKKIPELSKGIGESIKEIRKGFTGDTKDDDKSKKKSA
jgi:sec-independent protein translocase protein TatA